MLLQRTVHVVQRLPVHRHAVPVFVRMRYLGPIVGVTAESRVVGDKPPRDVVAAIGYPHPELVEFRVRDIADFAVKMNCDVIRWVFECFVLV